LLFPFVLAARHPQIESWYDEPILPEAYFSAFSDTIFDFGPSPRDNQRSLYTHTLPFNLEGLEDFR